MQQKCNVCSDFKSLRKKYAKDNRQELPCPPDSTELGSATWTFLHTMAAYYPENPTDEDKLIMNGMIKGLGRFYPCNYCADHLRIEVKRNPPKLDSNVALSDWFCQVHNEVNSRLGKPIFDCSKVLQRWRFGTENSTCFEEPQKE